MPSFDIDDVDVDGEDDGGQDDGEDDDSGVYIMYATNCGKLCSYCRCTSNRS